MYTKQDRREAEQYAETLIDEAMGAIAQLQGIDNVAEIRQWLIQFKSQAITQYMRDMTEWQQITLNNLTPDDVEIADCGVIKGGKGGANVFDEIVDRILLHEFMVNLTDIDHEIDTYLASEPYQDDAAEHEAADHQQRVRDYRAEVRS